MDQHEALVAVLQRVPSQDLFSCERTSRAFSEAVACESVWHARWMAEQQSDAVDDLLPTWRERVCVVAALRQARAEQKKTVCVAIDALGASRWEELMSLIHQLRSPTGDEQVLRLSQEQPLWPCGC